MKMNFKYLVLFSAILALFACGDNSITNINDEAKEKGDISFLVLDRTGEALDSVKIQRITDGKTLVTDEFGYSIWKKMEIGTHLYLLSKEGYAPIRYTVNLKDEGKGSVARVPDITQKVVMQKLGATIQGTVMYRDPSSNNLIAASNIPVILSFVNGNFSVTEVVVKTDKNGEYVFKDLPENSSASISIPQTSIEKQFYALSTDIQATIDRANEVQNMSISVLSLIAKNLSLIKSNLSEIDASTPLSLSFSSELDKDSIHSKWTVLTSSGIPVLTSVSLEDSKEISIEPVSGKWEKGEIYTVTGTAYNLEGGTVSVAQNFSVGKSATSAPGQVKGLEVIDDYPYVEITWEAPEGDVTGYDIYYMTNSMKDYLRLTSTANTTFRVLETNLIDFITDTSVKIIVLPYNNHGYPDITEAKAVKYSFN